MGYLASMVCLSLRAGLFDKKFAKRTALKPTVTPQELRWQRIQAQEKDTRAILARDFSASRMNTTKWKEVAACFADLSVQCRLKFVDVDKEFERGRFWYITGDWLDGSLGPFTANSIEWFEIDPVEEIRDGLLLKPRRIDHTAEVETQLQSASIPYHWENGLIRIIGHVRKGKLE